MFESQDFLLENKYEIYEKKNTNNKRFLYKLRTSRVTAIRCHSTPGVKMWNDSSCCVIFLEKCASTFSTVHKIF